MKVQAAILGLVFALACLTVPGIPAVAGGNPAVERIAGVGAIDWVGERLFAEGVGAPTTRKVGPAQARLLARRAAEVVARRNLLEVIKGVHIDSTTRLENRMAANDQIVSRVSGILVHSTVERVEYLPDGSARAFVSIPLTGELKRALMGAVVGGVPGFGPAGIGPEADRRFRRLEKRVEILEQKVDRLERVNVTYDDMVSTLGRIIDVWSNRTVRAPRILTVAADNGATADLDRQVRQQQAEMAALAAQVRGVMKRLEALEKHRASPATGGRGKRYPYTGLVIDARGLGFRPCLKPELYGDGGRFYPGDYIDFDEAVRNGYVRYFHDLNRAQKSDRVGTLPLTIKAEGTHGGERGLSLSASDIDTLRAISGTALNFLSECRVAIVF